MNECVLGMPLDVFLCLIVAFALGFVYGASYD